MKKTPYIRIIDDMEHRVDEICPKCGGKYRCIYTPQTPGFRDEEWKICPYCHEIIDKSWEEEFETYVID